MQDHKLLKGAFGNYYVSSVLKDGITMSSNRFEITKEMVFQMFEEIITEICIEKTCSTLGITNSKSEEIIEVKLKGELLDNVKQQVEKNRCKTTKKK